MASEEPPKKGAGPAPKGGHPIRGQIYWIDIKVEHTKGTEQFKRRPWVVMSGHSLNKKGKLVVAVPLTTQMRHKAGYTGARISIPASERLLHDDATSPLDDCDCLALTDQVRALAQTRLGAPVAVLSARAVAWLEAGLLDVLDLQ